MFTEGDFPYSYSRNKLGHFAIPPIFAFSQAGRREGGRVEVSKEGREKERERFLEKA